MPPRLSRGRRVADGRQCAHVRRSRVVHRLSGSGSAGADPHRTVAELRCPRGGVAHPAGAEPGRRSRVRRCSRRWTAASPAPTTPTRAPSVRCRTASFQPQAGFDVAWELDIWGRYRRGTEAAQAQLLASEDFQYGGHRDAGGRCRPRLSDAASPRPQPRDLQSHRGLQKAVAGPGARPGWTAAWPGSSTCGRPRRCCTARRRRSPRSSARSSSRRISSTSCSARILDPSSADVRSNSRLRRRHCRRDCRRNC